MSQIVIPIALLILAAWLAYHFQRRNFRFRAHLEYIRDYQRQREELARDIIASIQKRINANRNYFNILKDIASSDDDVSSSRKNYTNSVDEWLTDLRSINVRSRMYFDTKYCVDMEDEFTTIFPYTDRKLRELRLARQTKGPFPYHIVREIYEELKAADESCVTHSSRLAQKILTIHPLFQEHIAIEETNMEYIEYIYLFESLFNLRQLRPSS